MAEKKKRKKNGGDGADDAENGSPKEVSVEKKAKQAKGAPKWVVTFADLMSLLMCFFVMLLSMSEVDIEKFKAMIEGIDRGMDTKRSSQTMKKIDAKIKEKNKAKMASKEQTVSDAVMLQQLLRPMIQEEQIELLVQDQLIVIRILQGGSFKPGSADLKVAFKPIAKKLKAVFSEIEGTIAISGHTDDRPIKSRRFRSNFELSSARAYSVLHELLKGGDVVESRFVINGLGQIQPLAPNSTKENRNRNRRVEIIINQADVGYLEEDHNAPKPEVKDKAKPKMYETMPSRGG
ncbi:MAG: OmpA family protein [Deltaproteobacteria bacterium]|jgi:chemotaxis protein MotB|nr:OmpA family protein [Deltaproteobacteria bacterium]MBT6434710.1 OmpA family protein [Deltaproteobacteria bacterium]MBT6489609.1 OmpA family protein [Deltaproteobacteria bacterium]